MDNTKYRRSLIVFKRRAIGDHGVLFRERISPVGPRRGDTLNNSAKEALPHDEVAQTKSGGSMSGTRHRIGYVNTHRAGNL